MYKFFKKMFSSKRSTFKATQVATVVGKSLRGEVDISSLLFQQGNASIKNNNFAEAIAYYTKSVAIEPNNPLPYIGLGFALLQLREFGAAVEVLKIAVTLNVKSPDGFYMLGKAYFETGNLDAASDAWNKSYMLSPMIESLYCDFCLLLFNMGKAYEAKALIEAGINNYPLNSDFYFYLGNLHFGNGDHEAAVIAYERSIALTSPSPYLLSNYGTALRQIGHLDQSIEFIKAALALLPDAASIFSNYIFGMQYSSKYSKQEKFETHLEFAKRFEIPLMAHWGNYKNSIISGRKLKIGYVSGDFRNHSMIFFIEPIIKNHDKSRFEIYCYYSYPVHDEASDRIKKLADQWIGCSNMSDNDLALKIRADEIDILIDLSGHTGNNRLLTFARKPAPIQLTWLGYQATTGLKAMDFRITEESLDPIGTSENFHSEKLIRLPSSGAFSPSPDSPLVNTLPVLSGKPFTFGCLNNPSKITDEVIFIWSEILKENQSARLMIGNSTPDLINKISTKFLQHAISSERILFQPKVTLLNYLELHHQVDLALDTFPYNGGTTTFHSLWMGVPIIALHGDTTLSKVGVSIMCGLGFESFCGYTTESYIEKAVYYSRSPEELNVVRLSLREKMTEVTKNLSIEVTSSLENSLQACWLEYCEKAQVAMTGNLIKKSFG